MNRRTFLGTAGAAMAFGAPSSNRADTPKPASGPKRNIVLCVADDQGMDDAGCYGNPILKTPGLDELAAEGVRFTRAFCTTASCSASRSVILSGLHNHATGQYGHQHGYNHFVSFPEVRSLPALLRGAGYRTRCAGKYHVAPEEVYPFDEFLPVKAPEAMAESCRDLIASDDPRSFFLYFCTVEPHRPFKREGSDSFSPEDVVVPPYLPDIPECREELAQYYGSVQRADRGLKRIIALLKETGHWDDTLIIYISDNGIAFPGAKTTTYDPGLRLPCVVRNPFLERRGGVNDAMISWTDLTPTILEFAGVDAGNVAFHGRSFLGILGEESPPGWDEIYASHTFHEITMYYPMRVVRTRRYKLIWNIACGLEYPFASDLWESRTWQAVRAANLERYGKRSVEAYLHRPRFELYDIEKDPDEIDNLAQESEYAAALDELKRKLRAFQERTKDPWILKWDYE